jgi:triacylglycerol lipase
MGGILVRYYLKENRIPELGRVVMLSPPNGGSEVVDKLGGTFLFKWMNGPAGQQLGTGENSIPKQLGPVDFDLGIITGDRSINLILSCLIPGSDDGKVSIENAKVKGMKDFRVIHASHPFIMKNKEAMSQVVSFLKTGHFAGKKVQGL